MGLIRKQVGMDITDKIDAWCESFRKRHCWCNQVMYRGSKDNKAYVRGPELSLLFDIIEESEIPDYILISYKRCLPGKKIGIWYEPATKTPEMIVQGLNRIADHLEGLEAIILYDTDDNIVWSIRSGADKKWILQRKK